MIRSLFAAFISLSFVGEASCQTPPAPPAAEVSNVPRNNLIANPHVVKYHQLPTQWPEGLPLGNGEIGVMCSSDGKRLRFTLDSASAWDLRYNSEPDYSQLSYRKLREWVARGDFDAIRDAGPEDGAA